MAGEAPRMTAFDCPVGVGPTRRRRLSPRRWRQRAPLHRHPPRPTTPPSWLAVTENRRWLKFGRLSAAKRICQLWKNTFAPAALNMLAGDFETAERLRTEPDKLLDE
jgi:hypothetical protein